MKVLQLGSGIMPKLLGQDGRLLYEAKEKDKINKNSYKEYLAMLDDNLQSLSATKQYDMKSATHQDPLTASAVAAKLQGGMTGKIQISHGDHSKILSQQTAFYASAVEIVRRELVQYGMIVSNLAKETKDQRSKIRAIAKQLLGYLDAYQPKIVGKDKAAPPEDKAATKDN